ncbi:MAG: hypothetical protein ACYDBH_19450 [Acidobacteriaceae bacterium]
MTETTYAINVAARLQDDVTPPLLRIIDVLTRANALMLDFTASVRDVSRLGLAVGRSLDKAAAGAAALADASGGLTRASYVLDTMAASSADLARNMAAVCAESRGAMAGGGAIPRGPAGVNMRGGSGNDSGRRYIRHAAIGVGLSALYGLYENARLQDTTIRAAATSQIPFPPWISTADELRKREFAYASKYGFATGGHIAPFGLAMLESSRLLRTLNPANQRTLTDAAMPYAAVEAKLKGVPLPEAMLAFIGLAHQAGAYTPATATPLFESMMQTSLTTHSSLWQIQRAASYALPSLHAAGANSSDVMLMLGTMMQAGILNSKSGTWLNDMALNALPNTLGSGLFTNKNQNAALQALGLYTNGKSNFYKHGQLDLMKMVSILAADRIRMAPEQFNPAIRQAFALQGMRAAALFSEPQVLHNLKVLMDMSAKAQAPIQIAEVLRQLSPVAQGAQLTANAKMALMNATATFVAPLNHVLSGLSATFGWTAKYTAKHPVEGGLIDAALVASPWAVKWGAKKLVKEGLPWVWKRATEGLTREELLETIPEAATAALGVALAGAIGYEVGHLIEQALNHWIDKETHGGTLGTWLYHEFHHPYDPNAHNHITVQIDGEDVRHRIMKHSTPGPSRGAQGVNPLHAPLSPGLNFAPGL